VAVFPTSAVATPDAPASASSAAPHIEIERLVKRFDGRPAVSDFSASIKEGELLVLLGPSGCGKTTVMRSVAGLETPDEGVIAIGGTVMFDAVRGIEVRANRRNVGLVFQSYAVWPHMTVFENVAYPLRMRRVRRKEIRRRVEEILALFDLEELADRGASRLSGGQMQRVALARSVVMEPRALLLDEPLSNLDARLRDRLRVELRKIQQQLGITSIFVTHDQSEALVLADRVAVMRDGEIVQIDTPTAIYERPRSRFVAEFVGESNILAATNVERTDERFLVTVDRNVVLESACPPPPERVTWVCIRPEHVEIVPDAENGNTFAATIELALFMGSSTTYELTLENGLPLRMTHSSSSLQPGARVTVRIPPERVLLLDG
jgi:iron(III) transport system ATP-binding protein